MKKITIVGIGMGNQDTLTIAAKQTIEQAQVVFGAKRIVSACNSLYQEGTLVYPTYKTEEICDILDTCNKEHIVIVMSGDTGFYSGAKELKLALRDESVTVLPGISSVSYMFAKIGESWDDARLVSAHGRELDVVKEVRGNKKTFFLTANNIGDLCRQLVDAGLGEVTVFVGEHLSYAAERIVTGTANDFADQVFASISVMVVLNPTPNKPLTIGIVDEAFVRGKVPMTKSEVRAVILSKLKLNQCGIAYDVGAGTGSVSIEMALNMEAGQVYAVETNPEGVALIKENKEAFGVSNLNVIEGMAPEVLVDLPCPDSVFIGGSKGNMQDIFNTIRNKQQQANIPAIQIVVSAIALETLTQTLRIFEEEQIQDVDIAMVQVSKSKELGSYHMMMGQNPIYIISGRLQ